MTDIEKQTQRAEEKEGCEHRLGIFCKQNGRKFSFIWLTFVHIMVHIIYFLMIVNRLYFVTEASEKSGITDEMIEASKNYCLPSVLSVYFCSLMCQISLIRLSCSDLRSKLGKGK